GTTIFAITPSSMASYSIVALSVSISAMTSPALTASPSFLSHLARLPFSIVGDSAGMRMLVGMSAHRAGFAGVGRPLHPGLEHTAHLVDDLSLLHRHLAGIDACDMARDVGKEHAPDLGIVECTAQRDMEAAVDNRGTQHLEAAALQRRRRRVER